MSMIYTVRDNLKKTIEGKEAYLARIREIPKNTGASALVAEFLEININELKVILFDVEKACEQWNLMSWEINPERMGQ
jgi:hypothetical protein